MAFLRSLRIWRLATAAVLLAASSALAAEPLPPPEHDEVITRDVCIIGGGSAGTYAAVRLRDRGRSVVVVEQRDVLGGHTDTQYFADGSYINYGVDGVFGDWRSLAYLRRLGVAHKPLLPAAARTVAVDFRTGRPAGNGSAAPADQAAVAAAALQYRRAAERFAFLRRGTFDLPEPVPEELLRPFGDFVERHRLQAALDLVFAFASSVGDLLASPLLYVLQDFGLAHVDALLAGYVTPVKGMYELYRRAADVLGPDAVLYCSTAARVTRSSGGGGGVTVVVQDAHRGDDGRTGRRRRVTIKARKLVIAMPPTAANMAPLDLGAAERALFQQWEWQSYYAAVVNNSGLPDGVDVANRDPARRYGLPTPPFQWQLQYMGVPGYRASKLVAGAGFTARDARALILADIRRMAGRSAAREPQIVALADHTPTSMRVSAARVRGGFYRRLYALQGRRDTYYTGNAWCSDYSSLIWAYTDDVIDRMEREWER